MRGDDKIGTTLKGIGPAYADKARRVGHPRRRRARPGVRSPPRVKDRAAAENAALVAAGGDAARRRRRSSPRSPRSAPGSRRSSPTRQPAPRRARPAAQHLLLEGAQATFLDLDHGTYPYVTSSNPTAGGACAGTGLGPRDIDRIVGITKAYTTRVGAGPFPTELLDDDGDRLVDDRPRVRHRHRPPPPARLDRLRDAAPGGAAQLAHRDRAHQARRARRASSGSRSAPATASTARVLPSYPDRIELLAEVEPVYASSPAGGARSRDVREPGELPARGAATSSRSSRREVGVPVRVVGVGAERDDYLHLVGADDPAVLHAGDGGGLHRRRRGSRRWLEVELLATEAHAALGVVPAADAAACRERAPVVDDAFVAAVLEREARHRPRRRRVRRRRPGGDRRAGRVVDPLRADAAATSSTPRCAGCCATPADLLIDASSELLDDARRRSPARTATR